MQVELKQIRSAIGATERQKNNLRSLKLGRIGKKSIFESGSSVLGRYKIVAHLVEMREIAAESGKGKKNVSVE